MKIDDKLLGKAIARFRELRGLTQAQLNERTGMSTIQHIEQGRNSVSLTSLNKIATALDVPAACLTLLGSPVEKKDKVLSSLRFFTFIDNTQTSPDIEVLKTDSFGSQFFKESNDPLNSVNKRCL